jgi:ADP-ribose pyrophosphatase
MQDERWKILRTKLIGSFSIREVELPTQKRLDYLVISYPQAVAVLALTDDQRVVVVGQYRLAVNEYSWEIPSGGIEDGESAENCARRELREETGYSPKRIEPMIIHHPSNAAIDQVIHIFLALDLERTEPESGREEPVEQTIKVALVPFDDLLSRVQQGEIRDASTLIAVLLYAQRSLPAK